MRGTGLIRTQRPAEAMMLLRGAHEMALANNLESVHRRSRTLICFYEQFDDPPVGLALAREGLEYASRTGSLAYGFLMVGNGVVCALRVGDWEWARPLLDEWLANDQGNQAFLELFADRAVLRSLTGQDPQSDIAAAEARLSGIDDSQFESYMDWARAWAGLAAGDLDEATKNAVAAYEATRYFGPLVLPLAARAALWRGDTDAARRLVDELDQAFRGAQAGTMLDVDTLRAGLAALDGRRVDAVAGYREALRGWRQLGCTFDEALAAIDMASLLKPTEREMPEAASLVEDARQALLHMEAKPLVARLEAAVADRPPAPVSEPANSSVPVTA